MKRMKRCLAIALSAILSVGSIIANSSLVMAADVTGEKVTSLNVDFTNSDFSNDCIAVATTNKDTTVDTSAAYDSTSKALAWKSKGKDGIDTSYHYAYLNLNFNKKVPISTTEPTVIEYSAKWSTRRNSPHLQVKFADASGNDITAGNSEALNTFEYNGGELWVVAANDGGWKKSTVINNEQLSKDYYVFRFIINTDKTCRAFIKKDDGKSEWIEVYANDLQLVKSGTPAYITGMYGRTFLDQDTTSEVAENIKYVKVGPASEMLYADNINIDFTNNDFSNDCAAIATTKSTSVTTSASYDATTKSLAWTSKGTAAADQAFLNLNFNKNVRISSKEATVIEYSAKWSTRRNAPQLQVKFADASGSDIETTNMDALNTFEYSEKLYGVDGDKTSNNWLASTITNDELSQNYYIFRFIIGADKKCKVFIKKDDGKSDWVEIFTNKNLQLAKSGTPAYITGMYGRIFLDKDTANEVAENIKYVKVGPASEMLYADNINVDFTNSDFSNDCIAVATTNKDTTVDTSAAYDSTSKALAWKSKGKDGIDTSYHYAYLNLNFNKKVPISTTEPTVIEYSAKWSTRRNSPHLQVKFADASENDIEVVNMETLNTFEYNNNLDIVDSEGNWKASTITNDALSKDYYVFRFVINTDKTCRAFIKKDDDKSDWVEILANKNLQLAKSGTPAYITGMYGRTFLDKDATSEVAENIKYVKVGTLSKTDDVFFADSLKVEGKKVSTKITNSKYTDPNATVYFVLYDANDVLAEVKPIKMELKTGVIALDAEFTETIGDNMTVKGLVWNSDSLYPYTEPLLPSVTE